MAKKVPITIRLNPGQHLAISSLAQVSDMSINGVVAQALELLIQYKEAEAEWRKAWLKELMAHQHRKDDEEGIDEVEVDEVEAVETQTPSDFYGRNV
jgi:predicted transcriptional regulator